MTIALGIGVNAGIFTVLNGVLYRDLPAPDAHELVAIMQFAAGGRDKSQTGLGTFSASEYRAYRDGAQTLSGVLAHSNPTETTLGGDVPRQLYGVLVSCNYFAVGTSGACRDRRPDRPARFRPLDHADDRLRDARNGSAESAGGGCRRWRARSARHGQAGQCRLR